MALKDLGWPNTVQRRIYDLAAGYVSPRFDQILVLSDSLGERPASSPNGVTVTFTIAYAFGPNLPGVTFDAKTGEVSVQSLLPSLPGGKKWPQEMTVRCKATQGTESREVAVHVIVHEKLDRIWLTPNPLTVRKDAQKIRFSLLGKFSDGKIADLSNWSPMYVPDPSDPSADPTAANDRRFVHLAARSVPVVSWTSAGGGIEVPSNRTGFLNCTSETSNTTITAEVNQTPMLKATAKAKGAPSWTARTLLTPVTPASTFPSMGKRRNVLILPDGFDKNSQTEFEFYAREVVERLGSKSLTRPHDLLKNKFNFFTAWVPSPESDITVLSELMRRPYTGPPLPLTTPVYDGELFSSSAVNPITLLVNERDTAFHVAFGGRPDVSFSGSQDFPGFNPLRLDLEDFNAFLHHLTSKPFDTSHIPEGRTWTNGNNDEKLILFLCRSTHVGGVNSKWSETSRMMFVSLYDDTIHRVMEDVSGNGYETLVSTPNKAKATQSTWKTVAHEMGHSLRLGDEYGKLVPPIPAQRIPDIERWGNVQLLKDFTGGILNGSDIKWNWPRIAKAVPYLSLSHPDAAHIHTCELSGSYAEQSCKPDKIRPGDTVRLRLRNLFFNPKLSNELEVVSVEDMKIKLRPKGGGSPPGPPFLPALGSGPPGVMMVITKDKAGLDSGLVHFAIRVHISNTASPLDAPSGATSWTCSPTTAKDKLTTPTNLPSAPTPPVTWPWLKSWVIGVFEGGAAYNCDAYHATGECVMIDTDKATQFCHVCRYLLVDQIDPLKHGAIERDFAPNYPK